MSVIIIIVQRFDEKMCYLLFVFTLKLEQDRN